MITRTLYRFALLFLCGFVAAAYAGSQQLNYRVDPKKFGVNAEQIAQIDALLFDAPARPAPATE